MGSTKACVLGVCAGPFPGCLQIYSFTFLCFVSQGRVILVGGTFSVPKSTSYCLGSANEKYWQEFGM